jgi:hypothetical protein
MKPHPQPYTISWIFQGRDICVSQRCCFPYRINPFKDKVWCDISHLDVCDFILGKPYFWKRHDVYDSCNIPDIKSMQNINKMLEMAE